MENVIIEFEKKYSPGVIRSAGVIGGIFGGLILMLTGIFLTIWTYFRQPGFSGTVTVLFLGSLALLSVGAHSLDLIEREKKAGRPSVYSEGN